MISPHNAPDVGTSSKHTAEYNLSSDEILKVSKNIKFLVEGY